MFGQELPSPSGTGSFLTSLFSTVGIVGSEYMKLLQAKTLAEAQIKLAKAGRVATAGLPGAVSIPQTQPASNLTTYVLIGGVALAAVMLLSGAAKGKTGKK